MAKAIRPSAGARSVVVDCPYLVGAASRDRTWHLPDPRLPRGGHGSAVCFGSDWSPGLRKVAARPQAVICASLAVRTRSRPFSSKCGLRVCKELIQVKLFMNRWLGRKGWFPRGSGKLKRRQRSCRMKVDNAGSLGSLDGRIGPRHHHHASGRAGCGRYRGHVHGHRRHVGRCRAAREQGFHDAG